MIEKIALEVLYSSAHQKLERSLEKNFAQHAINSRNGFGEFFARSTYGRTTAVRVESIARNRGRTVYGWKQSARFSGRIAATKKYSLRCSLYFQFKNVLYAIRYLLATETFANWKVTYTTLRKRKLLFICDGPPSTELGVAKTFSITIMRLPRWKRWFVSSEALRWMSFLIVCVRRYLLL